MKTTIWVFALLLLMITIAACTENHGVINDKSSLQQNIEEYQRELIAQGVTGGSVAGVFRRGETLAYSIVNSDLPDDTPILPDTLFPIWSMSKPITTAAMMILHERGLYQVDDPVSKYLPYFADLKCKGKEGRVYPCKNELKISHLLTHRSGYGYYYQEGEPSHVGTYEDLDSFMRVVADYPVEFEPGTEYLYGINHAILGRIIEVLSGQVLYDFFNETIFEPLGMVNTKFELSLDDRARFQVLFKKPNYDETSLLGGKFDEGISIFSRAHDELSYKPGTKVQLGGEGLVSTFQDYQKFCEMLLGKGVYQGIRILDEQSIEMMAAVVTEGGVTRGYDEGFDFGYSLFVLNKPVLDGTGSSKGIFGWSGYHNTHFWIDHEKNIYGLFMTRTTPFSWGIQRNFRSAVYRGLN